MGPLQCSSRWSPLGTTQDVTSSGAHPGMTCRGFPSRVSALGNSNQGIKSVLCRVIPRCVSSRWSPTGYNHQEVRSKGSPPGFPSNLSTLVNLRVVPRRSPLRVSPAGASYRRVPSRAFLPEGPVQGVPLVGPIQSALQGNPSIGSSPGCPLQGFFRRSHPGGPSRGSIPGVACRGSPPRRPIHLVQSRWAHPGGPIQVIPSRCPRGFPPGVLHGVQAVGPVQGDHARGPFQMFP